MAPRGTKKGTKEEEEKKKKKTTTTVTSVKRFRNFAVIQRKIEYSA